MSYRKIRRTSYLGNLERCLTLRQQYAKVMLDLLAQHKRVLYIDESTIPSCDYRHQKWGIKGKKNTVTEKDLSEKINMIAGLCTEGHVYAALT